DPFPLLQEKFVFALVCSSRVPLQKLSAANQTNPERPSPLEQADGLVESGQFAAAEQRYAAEVAQGSGSRFYDEACYKQGCCLLSQNRPDDALPLFESVLRRTDPQWALLSGCQLWVLHLKAARTTKAGETLDFLRSRFDPREFALMVPSEARDQLLRLAWKAETVSSARLTQAEGGGARVEASFRILNLVAPDDPRNRGAAQLIGRAYELDRGTDHLPRAIQFYRQYWDQYGANFES